MIDDKKNKEPSFFDEKEYRLHISEEIKFVTRLVSALGVVMFALFYVVDFWAFLSPPPSLLYIRATVAVVLVLTFLSTYHKDFSSKWVGFILPIPYLAASTGVTYIIFLANPADYASQIYFVGLMLIIMMLFAWSFLKLAVSFITSAMILSSYIYVVLNRAGVDNASSSELVINLIFLLSAALIGVVSQFIRDRHLKENFLLQQSLKEVIKEKTIEARDNEYLANHDPLTDLPNRRYVTELLEESLEIAKAKERILAILFLDLNGFKQVNDVYGHTVGDEVLVIVAKRLELAVRKGDRLARLGGDEYLVGLMMDRENLSDIKKMAAKFTAIISEPMNIEGLEIKIGVSVGIAAYPMHGNKVSVLLDIADKKMYKVKHGLRKVVKNREQRNIEPVVIFPGNSIRK